MISQITHGHAKLGVDIKWNNVVYAFGRATKYQKSMADKLRAFNNEDCCHQILRWRRLSVLIPEKREEEVFLQDIVALVSFCKVHDC